MVVALAGEAAPVIRRDETASDRNSLRMPAIIDPYYISNAPSLQAKSVSQRT